jgi:transcriptional regulator with XRE-family HTH domain
MNGAMLKEARKLLKWSQSEAAEHFGVGLSTYQRWEAGSVTPHPEHARKIDSIYGPILKEEEPQETPPFVVATPNKTALPEPPALSSYISLYIPHADPDDLPPFLLSDLTMRLMSLCFLPQDQRFAIADRMAHILEEFAAMNADTWNYQQTRRDALFRLASIPLVTLGLNKLDAQVLPAKYPIEDVLTQCAAGLAACKELSKGSESATIRFAFQTASRYIVVLQSVMEYSPEHRKEAAGLVAQCFRLKTVLARHIESLQNAAIYAQEAVNYAQEASDPTLVVSMQTEQAWVYYSDQRTHTGIVVIHQALPLLKDISREMSARVLSTQSVLEAKVNKSSPESFNQARDMLQSLSITQSSSWTIPDLIWNQGLVHYYCREYGEALDEFGQLIDLDNLSKKMPTSVTSRVSILNSMTLATLKKSRKDMDQTMLYWEEAINIATKLGSRPYFLRALAVYDAIEALWPNEQRVKEGRDLIAELQTAP